MPGNADQAGSQYNEPADKKAYQKQVREQARERYEGKEWWPENPDLSTARVRKTNRDVAQKIIREYEWLGTLPPVNNYCGIFFHSEDSNRDPWACGGVTCWNDKAGAASNLTDMYGIEQGEIAYLQRGACVHWAPANTNSKLISYSLNIQKDRGKKVAIAYSDADAGEIGTVYQATGWYCIGHTDAMKWYKHPDTGVCYPPRRISQIRERQNNPDMYSWTDIRDEMLDRGWEAVRKTPKIRYMKILADGDEKARIYQNVRDKITGYPKRERDVLGGPEE